MSDGSQKHDVWGGGLRMHTKPWVRARAKKEYWATLNPSSGRPFRYQQCFFLKQMIRGCVTSAAMFFATVSKMMANS